MGVWCTACTACGVRYVGYGSMMYSVGWGMGGGVWEYGVHVQRVVVDV